MKHIFDGLQWTEDLLDNPAHVIRWPPKQRFCVRLGGGMVAMGMPPPMLGESLRVRYIMALGVIGSLQ